jgi:hypothetical protein
MIANYDNMLVQYKRTKKGNPQGVVVAIAPGIIGWSLCNKKDRFLKEKAIDIAAKRALKALYLDPVSRSEDYYTKIPFTLSELSLIMLERSEKYFHKEIKE